MAGSRHVGPFSSQCRAGNVKILPGSWNEDLFRVTLLHGSVVRRRGVDGISGTPFLTADHHRAIQSQPRSPSSHPEAAAQSDELGCL